MFWFDDEHNERKYFLERYMPSNEGDRLLNQMLQNLKRREKYQSKLTRVNKSVDKRTKNN